MKALKIILIIFAILIGIVLLTLLGVKVGEKLRYHEFYARAQKEFKTPGISDNLVQQGMVYIEEKNLILVCGYMSDDTSSRVYVLDGEGKLLSHSELRHEDGSVYTGHTGGMEYYGNCLYITEGTKEKGYDGGLDVFPLDKILAGEQTVNTIGRVKTYNNPAYCHIENGYMLVGEFYRAESYETADSHRMRTPAGDENNALLTVFKLDDSALHISGAPVAGISTRGLVQGMCVTEQYIVLSTSWSVSSSHLYVYDKEAIPCTPDVTVDGITMPVYHFDSAALLREIELPPMSEEMLYKNGRIFILSESACNKYIYGKFMSGGHVYSYELPEVSEE